MNYAYQYFKIIANRVEHPISKADDYCEKHHIIPKSEGGKDEPDNLVNLTAREHYIAHLLLAKIYDDRKMWSAVKYMQTGRYNHRKFRFNSILYEVARKEFGRHQSNMMRGKPSPMKGRKLSEETKRKISKASKGRRHSEESKYKMAEALRGIKRSEETRRKLSEAHKGKPSPNGGKKQSDEARRKNSESHKGRRWFNNGVKSVMAYECPVGFVKGRLKRNGSRREN